MASTTSLHPLATYDSAVQYRTHLFWSRLWKVALATSICAFITLAVFVINSTAALAPVHLPMITLIVLGLGLPLSGEWIISLWKKAHCHSKEAQYALDLQNHVKVISDVQLPKLLNSYGIDSSANPKIQKELIARYQILESEAAKYAKLSEQKSTFDVVVDNKIKQVTWDDMQISNVNFDDPKQVKVFESVQQQLITQAKAKQQFGVCKIKMAHLLNLIQNPQDRRSLTDCLQLKALHPSRIFIAKYFEDASATVLAVANSKAYTYQQIEALSTARLAKQIFGTKLRHLWLQW